MQAILSLSGAAFFIGLLLYEQFKKYEQRSIAEQFDYQLERILEEEKAEKARKEAYQEYHVEADISGAATFDYTETFSPSQATPPYLDDSYHETKKDTIQDLIDQMRRPAR